MEVNIRNNSNTDCISFNSVRVHGLHNERNNCHLNSVFQALITSIDVDGFLQSIENFKKVREKYKNDEWDTKWKSKFDQLVVLLFFVFLCFVCKLFIDVYSRL